MSRSAQNPGAQPHPRAAAGISRGFTLAAAGGAGSGQDSGTDSGDRPLFSKQSTPQADDGRPWKLLIVDDEPEVHSITRLALSDFRFRDRGLEFLQANSGREAREAVARDPEIAVILLDVVMETEDAGLRVVEFIRNELRNPFVRIVLRTGHHGLVPERELIQSYDINDYRTKTELTQPRLHCVLHAALGTYVHLVDLAKSRRYLTALSEENMSMLDRMAGNFHAPVQRVSEAVRELRAALETQTPEDLKRQWELLADGVDRISDLNRNLWKLSAVGMPEQIAEDFSGDEAMQDIRAELEDEIAASGTDIHFAPFPTLHGYRAPFLRMMEELLRNALRAQRGCDEAIEVAINADGPYWRIAVADRGPGIEPDRREEIFQPYVGSPQESGAHNGGLGLVFCRKVAALHGGRIWIEDRDGGGAAAIVQLPAHSAPPLPG